MPLPLEQEIMRKIGLGMPYLWYAGTYCTPFTARATRDLPNVIRALNQDGNSIAEPHAPLTALLEIASARERHNETLELTWQVASEVIRVHMEAAAMPEESRASFYQERLRLICEIYGIPSKKEELFEGIRVQ